MAADSCHKRSVSFLKTQGASQTLIDTVAFVLDRIGFKESLKSSEAPGTCSACGSETEMVLHIVQDADRLDALGVSLALSIAMRSRGL